MPRIWFALIVGIGGVAILVSLGIWQVQRLAWKEALLAEIETRIVAPPAPLPAAPDRAVDRYLPVVVAGRFADRHPAARMLASRRHVGAVHRQIARFDTEEGRRILVDLGWTPADGAAPELPGTQVTLTGNLDWPRETDGFTPDPADELWFARDVDAMAATLDTMPILLVLRETPAGVDATAWPVDTASIPNDHLQYAITWFSLAAIWSGMTAFFVLRKRLSDPEEPAR